MQIPHVDGLHVTRYGPGPFHLRKPLDQELRDRRQDFIASANFDVSLFQIFLSPNKNGKPDKADANIGHVTTGKCSLAD